MSERQRRYNLLRRRLKPPANANAPIVIVAHNGEYVGSYERFLAELGASCVRSMAAFDAEAPMQQWLIDKWGHAMIRTATARGCIGWKEIDRWLTHKYGAQL